jgi:hypothetical protein
VNPWTQGRLALERLAWYWDMMGTPSRRVGAVTPKSTISLGGAARFQRPSTDPVIHRAGCSRASLRAFAPAGQGLTQPPELVVLRTAYRHTFLFPFPVPREYFTAGHCSCWWSRCSKAHPEKGECFEQRAYSAALFCFFSSTPSHIFVMIFLFRFF